MVVGLFLRLAASDLVLTNVSFNYQMFFNLLLPPIILASGYELHQANFFRNIGAILTFAFAGTFISAIVLGCILFLWTSMRLDGVKVSFIDAIAVGATLSATDPVTILAIFNAYKVDPKLYTIIFGESILNDAIAIVLFETAQKYKEHDLNFGVGSMISSIGTFIVVFFSSLVVGLIIGMATSLLLKFTYLRRFPKTESCIIILIAYMSYFFSNAVQLSGKLIRVGKCYTNRRRYCVASVLRNLSEALCLSQHVPPNPAHHKVCLPNYSSALGKFHLHLLGVVAFHRANARLQATIYPHHHTRSLFG
jgi:sodium/hydrogen exchanger-like protein 6/7